MSKLRLNSGKNESIFIKLFRIINSKYPNYASQWLNSLKEFGKDWEEEISSNISKVFGPEYNDRWEEAVTGYAAFCTEALRAQVFFEKHGHYKASNYSDIVKECYHDADYMKVRYLPGQYLSHYIWPHHQRMLRHFISELIPKIIDRVFLFYEVGVGCGMYSQKSLQLMPKADGVGYDISDYALEFTSNVIKSHNLQERYKIKNQNIISRPVEKKADFIISQEVLEHLEDPQSFIDGLYNATRPDGWGYITAAINAGHTDHIFLYRTPKEVRTQIEQAGWSIHDEQIESNYMDKPIELRPTIVGYLTRR